MHIWCWRQGFHSSYLCWFSLILNLNCFSRMQSVDKFCLIRLNIFYFILDNKSIMEKWRTVSWEHNDEKIIIQKYLHQTCLKNCTIGRNRHFSKVCVLKSHNQSNVSFWIFWCKIQILCNRFPNLWSLPIQTCHL